MDLYGNFSYLSTNPQESRHQHAQTGRTQHGHVIGIAETWWCRIAAILIASADPLFISLIVSIEAVIRLLVFVVVQQSTAAYDAILAAHLNFCNRLAAKHIGRFAFGKELLVTWGTRCYQTQFRAVLLQMGVTLVTTNGVHCCKIRRRERK